MVSVIVYTRNPCTVPRRANTGCPLVPTDFSAIAGALGRLICICDAVALDNIGTIGIEPVIFGPPRITYNHITARCWILATNTSHQAFIHVAVHLSVCENNVGRPGVRNIMILPANKITFVAILVLIPHIFYNRVRY